MRAARAAAWLAAAGLALAPGCSARPAEPTSSLAVRARAVEIAPDQLRGLTPLGSFVLTAEHAEFGGFSGLLVDGRTLLAVTDAGWLLSAGIAEDDPLRLGPATFEPLPGGGGRGGKSTSDAESLARLGGGLAVGFERDHRIEVFEGGRATAELRDRRFERLASNSGFEALATLPDGRLLAIAEVARQGAFPAFLLGPDGEAAAGGVPATGRHEVTGADVGPDGRLYLLRRDWSLFLGFSIRVERYALADDGFPRPETREVLAEFESHSGIENMEGIAVWRDALGRTRLTLISDDNFTALLRTLLMDFVVE